MESFFPWHCVLSIRWERYHIGFSGLWPLCMVTYSPATASPNQTRKLNKALNIHCNNFYNLAPQADNFALVKTRSSVNGCENGTVKLYIEIERICLWKYCYSYHLQHIYTYICIHAHLQLTYKCTWESRTIFWKQCYHLNGERILSGPYIHVAIATWYRIIRR